MKQNKRRRMIYSSHRYSHRSRSQSRSKTYDQETKKLRTKEAKKPRNQRNQDKGQSLSNECIPCFLFFSYFVSGLCLCLALSCLAWCLVLVVLWRVALRCVVSLFSCPLLCSLVLVSSFFLFLCRCLLSKSCCRG
jgi:hypothetical protein